MATSSQNQEAGPAVSFSSCEAGPAVPVSSCEAGSAVPVFDKKEFQRMCREANISAKCESSGVVAHNLLTTNFNFLLSRLRTTVDLNLLRKRSAIFEKNAEEQLVSEEKKHFSRNEPAIASDRMNREARSFFAKIKEEGISPEWLHAWECVIYNAFQSLTVAFPERTKQTPEGDVIIVFEGFKNELEKPKHYDDSGLKPFKKTN